MWCESCKVNLCPLCSLDEAHKNHKVVEKLSLFSIQLEIPGKGQLLFLNYPTKFLQFCKPFIC